jgi:hypothetical protein
LEQGTEKRFLAQAALCIEATCSTLRWRGTVIGTLAVTLAGESTPFFRLFGFRIFGMERDCMVDG